MGGVLLEELEPAVLAPEALARTLARIDAPAAPAPARAPMAAGAPSRLRASLPAGVTWPRSLRGATSRLLQPVPGSPAAPIFNAAGVQLNGIIRPLAGQFEASFVDTAGRFMGHEVAYTNLDERPDGSSVPDPFGGVLPIGNVHPNEEGYDVIAAQVVGASGLIELRIPRHHAQERSLLRL